MLEERGWDLKLITVPAPTLELSTQRCGQGNALKQADIDADTRGMATRFVELLEAGKVLVVFRLHGDNCIGVLAELFKNAHLGSYCWERSLIFEMNRYRQVKAYAQSKMPGLW